MLSTNGEAETAAYPAVQALSLMAVYSNKQG